MKINLYQNSDGTYHLHITTKERKGILKLFAYANKIKSAIERNEGNTDL